MKYTGKQWIAISVAAALLVTGGKAPATVFAGGKPTVMALNYTSLLVKLHGKQTLKVASVSPANASKAVKYEIANRRVATVSGKGVVRGKRIGVTTIRVTSRKNKKLHILVKVMVAKVVPQSVKMSKKKLTMTTGQTRKLQATVKPAKVLSIYKKGTWLSSDKEIVSVSSKGKITANQEGTATITFTTLNGKKAACVITVHAAAQPTAAPETAAPAVPVSGGSIAGQISTGSAIAGQTSTGSAVMD